MKLSRRVALKYKQRQLMAESAQLRLKLARQSTVITKPLAWLELASLVMLSLRRPRVIFGWGADLFLSWQILQRARVAWRILRP